MKALASVSRWEFILLIKPDMLEDTLVKVEVKSATADILFLSLLVGVFSFLALFESYGDG